MHICLDMFCDSATFNFCCFRLICIKNKKAEKKLAYI